MLFAELHLYLLQQLLLYFSNEVFVSYQHREVVPGCHEHPGDIVEASSLAVSRSCEHCYFPCQLNSLFVFMFRYTLNQLNSKRMHVYHKYVVIIKGICFRLWNHQTQHIR